ncbi:hypothetical protein C5167_034115 [Papaver somniferum]|uniref:Transmembrane protein 135 N-terminal domain-containing protein n=1 Tax=Papaver somniferum TaxID=3469 RepID=A0A4Y7K7D0_PAPSO|nr:hypothetical protein C5167_034115 [Papaver somniferum]
MAFLSKSAFSSFAKSDPPSPSPEATPPDNNSNNNNISAEDRLREAEDRLREAIEELQRRQRRNRGLHECAPPCEHADESCIAHAIGNLCQTFLLSYGVRVGIGILLRAFKLARRQSYSSLLDLKVCLPFVYSFPSVISLILFRDLKQLVSEKDLIVREEACRIGLLFGGFTGSYHLLRCLLRKFRKKETPFNAILAGSVAGLSILALDDPSRRRTLALYLLARLGQVMYAFVMRPESLPKSYQDFIQKTGPVAKPIYKAVRDSCRGSPIDVVSLSAYLFNSKASSSLKIQEFPSIIPCSMIHPDANSCLQHNARAASATFRKTFPLYFSLTFVPFVVLRLQKEARKFSRKPGSLRQLDTFMDSPARTCWLAVKGAVRSTTFLSSFVGIFQGVICLHRKVAAKDHKLVYWLAGGFAALSVLLEKKARRGELALYVLPRAGDSLWYILVNRHFLPDIKNAEVALFCLCMGGIMYYLEHEPDTMAPFLRGIIRRFLASRITNPPPSANRTASYLYLQSLEAAEKPKLLDSSNGTEVPASEKLNLESIPGL